MGKPKIPTNPIELAFWCGWYSSAESHCKNFHNKPNDTWRKAWNKAKKHLAYNTSHKEPL